MTLYIAAWPVDGAAEATRTGAETPTPVLLSFAAPDYGIVFRCRVVCKLTNAVANAAITGLRFLEVSLKRANIGRVTLITDSPAYYFQVTGQTKTTNGSPEECEMLQEYRQRYKLEFRLTELPQNPARHNCYGMAKTPSDVEAPLTYNPLQWPQKGKMMPLQNGIEL